MSIQIKYGTYLSDAIVPVEEITQGMEWHAVFGPTLEDSHSAVEPVSWYDTAQVFGEGRGFFDDKADDDPWNQDEDIVELA